MARWQGVLSESDPPEASIKLDKIVTNNHINALEMDQGKPQFRHLFMKSS